MKLMLIIVGDEYAAKISAKLKEHAFMATEVGSNGEFLQYGETILLLGVKEQECDQVLSILAPEKGLFGDDQARHVSIYITSIEKFIKVNA